MTTVDAEEIYTRCPDCGTVFRVTPEQLATRNGQVRCGHCKTVFDGNSRRIDPALVPASNAFSSETVTLTHAEAGVSAAPSSIDDESPADGVASGAATDASTVPMSVDASAGIASEGGLAGLAPAGASAEVAGTSDVVVSRGASEAIAEADASPDPESIDPTPPAALAPDLGIQATVESAGPPPDVPYEDRYAVLANTRGRVRAKAYAIAALFVLLVGQAMYQFRDAIASGWPGTRPALIKLCDAVGCAIRPLRDPGMAFLSIEASLSSTLGS